MDDNEIKRQAEETTRRIKAGVQELLALCAKANPYGTKSQVDADVAFWSLVKQLDRQAKDGQHPVNPGRFVRLLAKDSYAYYIVIKVTKKVCKLVHIPYGLKYESNAVRDGEADIDVIERTLSFYDKIEARFVEMGKKPVEDRTAEYGIRDENIETEIARIMRLNGINREEALFRMFNVR